MAEERMDQIEEKQRQQEAASFALLGIVKESDKKLDEVVGTARSIQVQQTMLDARMGAVDARLHSVESRVSTLSQDVVASFRQVEAAMATKEDLAGMETRVNARMEEMRMQMLSAFGHVLSVLDERLPKKEE